MGVYYTDGMEVLDSNHVRIAATITTQLQGYGRALVDPREYPKDSVECRGVRSMAATWGELPPSEQPDQAGSSQAPLVQAVNMFEGEDEFAG